MPNFLAARWYRIGSSYLRLPPEAGCIGAHRVRADGKLYYASQFQGTCVIAAQPTFELLAQNVFDWPLATPIGQQS